jgi:hypothetical protein
MTGPSNTTHQIASTTKGRFVEAIALSAQLRKRVQARLSSESDFRSLECAIEALPIATNEYAWLENRVRNARMYVEQREVCAAAYELALVTNRLLARRRLWHEPAIDKQAHGVQRID